MVVVICLYWALLLCYFYAFIWMGGPLSHVSVTFLHISAEGDYLISQKDQIICKKQRRGPQATKVLAFCHLVRTRNSGHKRSSIYEFIFE